MNLALLPKLEKLLLQEIRIYEGYNALTALERKVITPFIADKVIDASNRRDQFVSEMNRLHIQRQEMLFLIFDVKDRKLSDLIELNLKGADLKKFRQIAAKLKLVASNSMKDTRELGSIVKFGMGMVDGILSILWSATEHVTKSYTRMGGMKETTSPGGNRLSSVLKKV